MIFFGSCSTDSLNENFEPGRRRGTAGCTGAAHGESHVC